MKIIQLIARLLSIHKKHGNIDVWGNAPYDDTFTVGRVDVATDIDWDERLREKKRKVVLLSQKRESKP